MWPFPMAQMYLVSDKYAHPQYGNRETKIREFQDIVNSDGLLRKLNIKKGYYLFLIAIKVCLFTDIFSNRYNYKHREKFHWVL